jgi:hypothetical protein
VAVAEDENVFGLAGREGRFYGDRKDRQFVPKQSGAAFGDALAAGRHQQPIRDFGGPMRGNDDSVAAVEAA